jgi:hypothetical protein
MYRLRLVQRSAKQNDSEKAGVVATFRSRFTSPRLVIRGVLHQVKGRMKAELDKVVCCLGFV